MSKIIRKTFFNDIILKNPEFDALSEQNKTLFLFNLTLTLIFCKTLPVGYFIFEAIQKRKQRT